MGFSCVNIKYTQLLLSITPQNNLLRQIKTIFIAIITRFLFIWRAFSFGRRQNDDEIENCPSPSLVPVPIYFMVQSLKNQLPVMEYSCLVERRSIASDDNEDPVCIFCMNCIERSDKVRELGNCNHVFHRDCLDAWIDCSNATCPLCKCKLLPAQENDSPGSDLWRKERMVYLFGEDEMHTSCF